MDGEGAVMVGPGRTMTARHWHATEQTARLPLFQKVSLYFKKLVSVENLEILYSMVICCTQGRSEEADIMRNSLGNYDFRCCSKSLCKLNILKSYIVR